MPVVSAAMVARSSSVGEPRRAPGGEAVAWTVAFDGRVDVVAASVGAAPVVLTADVPLTPVAAHGGAGYCWAGAATLVVATAAGGLVALPASGGPAADLVPPGAGLVHGPVAAPDGRVACVVETDRSCAVLVVHPDGAGEPRALPVDADFARDPAWSPSGDALAWHEWDLPDMPWDASRIRVVPADGRSTGTVVAGGDGVAVGQPRFAPGGGGLGFVSDRDGWMNLWRGAVDGSAAAPVLAEPHEHARPAWGPGQQSWAWSPDGRAVAVVRNEDGFGRLVVLGADGTPRSLGGGWHHALTWAPGGILAVRSGARTPDAVVAIDPDRTDAPADRPHRRVLARGPVGGFEAADLGEPEVLRCPVGGTSVPALLFRPASRLDEPPPVLVEVHGGPHDQALVEFRARRAYWLDRGWAVLAPQHRGSSGFGREYLRALDGRWGELDVADTAAVLRHAVRIGAVPGDRVAVTGRSAGGFTALLVAIEHPDLVRAAVSVAGVTDLDALAAATHRFESGYLDRLVASGPGSSAVRHARSPARRVADLRVPVLLLQGEDDPVVPADQAAAMVAAARRAGAVVEHHRYPGEGHSIRRVAHVVDELERTEAFLRRHVLDPARGSGR